MAKLPSLFQKDIPSDCNCYFCIKKLPSLFQKDIPSDCNGYFCIKKLPSLFQHLPTVTVIVTIVSKVHCMIKLYRYLSRFQKCK